MRRRSFELEAQHTRKGRMEILPASQGAVSLGGVSLGIIITIIAILALVAGVICALRRATKNVNKILREELRPENEPARASDPVPQHPTTARDGKPVPLRPGNTLE